MSKWLEIALSAAFAATIGNALPESVWLLLGGVGIVVLSAVGGALLARGLVWAVME
jgi:hypothetical protein